MFSLGFINLMERKKLAFCPFSDIILDFGKKKKKKKQCPLIN